MNELEVIYEEVKPTSFPHCLDVFQKYLEFKSKKEGQIKLEL